MKSQYSKRSGGFTLVELLVAIMILTLFMTASMGAVRIASRSWAAGQERSDTTEEMRATADFLRRQFAQLLFLTIGEGDEQRLLFIADQKHVRFVAPAPQYSQGAGLITYILTAEAIEEDNALTLRYAPFDPGSDELSNDYFSEPVVLATGFDGIGFQFYGAPTQDDDTEWRASWEEDAENYPKAIIIRTRSEPGADGWPDLVFELRSGDQS
jgi:general secretion pathway protein J